MQSFDGGVSYRTCAANSLAWRPVRLPRGRESTAFSNQIGRELRAVFKVAQPSDASPRLQELLEQIEARTER